MRKETSTNALNERNIKDSCSMAMTVSLLSGRWKPMILWHLGHHPYRYSALKSKITGSTERMLVKQLQELERDRLIIRKLEKGRPPRVTYFLSAEGKALLPLLKQMEIWGDHYKELTKTEPDQQTAS